ncbi:hypothetical protein QCA50_003960 [Cerrena zonata]|uniref:Peptidase C14 caspase domain-containing protein n=1 Tax=Cerrena zonata TaxID=2478898 RepID=A0AAW0GSX2_9APHY
MATKLFAVIVGIDKYKSGNIWDLETCVNDAQSVKRWLTHDLHVPRDQICLLTDKQATQRSIEDNFMKHLVNNPTIERGDSILFYFAGHGSSSRAPKGWFGHNSKTVEVLCPYDHDTKGPSGRVPGLSDRSLHAMMKDLSSAKGDNITLILDCSFQSPTSRVALRERRHCRWTPTTKATPDDLDAALWRSALGYSSKSPCRGFSGIACETHIVLTACRSGEGANESKAGGKFTQALLATKNAKPIHHMTYNDFMHHIENRLEEDQHPMCVGLRKHRTIFNGVPFMCDARYVPVTIYDEEKFRVDAGAIHGITEGTEFSFHKHNRQGSLNPVLATFSAAEVHPTWCLVRNRSTPKTTIDNGWARITRWNNRTPFRVHIRRSIFQFFRRLRLRRLILPKRMRCKHAQVSTLSVSVIPPKLISPSNCVGMRWY